MVCRSIASGAAGTVGAREYWAHITRLGFGFPGERGGIPQAVVYQDVGHVLTGSLSVARAHRPAAGGAAR